MGSRFLLPGNMESALFRSSRLAYQVLGDGPVEIVWSGSFASNVELYWAITEFCSLMEQLGAFARVLLFDEARVVRPTRSRDRSRHGRRRLRKGRHVGLYIP